MKFAIRSVAFVALLCTLLAGGVIGSTPISAASGNPAYCDSDIDRLNNLDIQDKVPVILVNGFNGQPQDWGDVKPATGFVAAINNQVPNAVVAHRLKYSSGFWVDHPNNGPKLAKTIDCLSRLSLQNGGKGKVAVVGYSMGGLVARDAHSRRSTDGQRAIADQAEHVTTIGSPHIGTTLPLAGGLIPGTLLAAFTPGSPGLTRLPHFPPQTVVHTIAGDVVRVYYDKRGNEVKRERPYDDTLVTTLSANAEYSIDVNKGGGETTLVCEKRYHARGIFGRYQADKRAVPCEHTQLINDPGNGVREDTVNALRKYVASLTSTSLTVGSLTTVYDNQWKDVYSGINGPGRDGSAKDITNGVPCTNCTTVPVPTAYAFMQLEAYGQWCNGPVQTCAVRSYPVVGAAPSVIIGGRAPDYSARYLDSGYAGTSLVWCFTDQQVCVHYRRGADRPQLELSQAALKVFSTAIWSN